MPLEDLTRREFVRMTGTASLGLMSGLDFSQQDNIYYTNYDDSIPEPEVHAAMKDVEKNFRTAGISVSTNPAPRGSKPEMQGLDSHVVITPIYLGRYPKDYFDPETWDGPKGYVGRHGLPQESVCCAEPILDNLNRITGDGYTEEEANSHLVSIVPNGTIAKSRRGDIRETITNLTTHEQGHGYGAFHLISDEDYFMSPQAWELGDPVFHPITVETMKGFIRDTRHLTRREINEERRESWENEIEV